ncbi:hypothetical protein MtrunA17_Chr6g0450061 [Medicago truncatula]|uniref:Transmembrane protein, putative n=1 Tax=Medicago truncatula TaxID=3880 RepID=G7KHM2_MEDTR|nr:transmembrane protein, putative [Medicago truncatula]RHN49763.1 hypothetical protein MtrunA17_Chr6g0450061 [Medicago truncatula]
MVRSYYSDPIQREPLQTHFPRHHHELKRTKPSSRITATIAQKEVLQNFFQNVLKHLGFVSSLVTATYIKPESSSSWFFFGLLSLTVHCYFVYLLISDFVNQEHRLNNSIKKRMYLTLSCCSLATSIQFFVISLDFGVLVIIAWVGSWTFLIPHTLLIELLVYVRNVFINIADTSTWLLYTIINAFLLVRGVIIPVRHNHGDSVAIIV